MLAGRIALSRRALASVICPSAPFLVPVGALVALRNAIPHNLGNQQRHKGQSQSQFRARRLRQRNEPGDEPAPHNAVDNEVAEMVFQFRGSLADEELHKVMQLYPLLASKQLLSAGDVAEMARVLHNSFRRSPEREKMLPSLLEYADRIVADLQASTLPPHPKTSLRLLSFFKEARQFERGLNFWAWLVQQGSDVVDGSVYGAAIELGAYYDVPLQTLEEIYKRALALFPEEFAEYHFSPNAVFANQSHPTIPKGLPMSLLQGIFTARLLRGAWREAYLAFDTALRLFPDGTPPRFFELLMHERPLSESFQVFLMACRSGVVLHPKLLTYLLNNLVAGMHQTSSLSTKFTMMKGELNAIFAYIGVGGTINGHHLSVLVKGLSHLLPEQSSDETSSERGRIAQLLCKLARDIIISFSASGIHPKTSTMNSLITMGGRAMHGELVGQVVADMANIDMKPDSVTYRATLAASGRLKEPDLVEYSWEALVEAKKKSDEQLLLIDWQTLALAGKRADHVNYVSKQLSTLNPPDPDIEAAILEELESQVDVPEEAVVQGPFEVKAWEDELKSLMKRASSLFNFIRSRRLLNFAESPLPMALDEQASLGSKEDLRKIYDELTASPDHTVPGRKDTEIITTPKGFPYGELRFENWLSVTQLLAEAEQVEAQKLAAVDEAIAHGTPLPASHQVSVETSVGAHQSVPDDGGPVGTVPDDLSSEGLKERIVELRRMAA